MASTELDTPPTKICVFCGSRPGQSPLHLEAARDLARALHRNKISLVYGGGTVGLMGEVARTLVSLAGPDSVHGIIPAPLVKYEQGPDSAATQHAGEDGLPDRALYGRSTVVKDMHTRKHMMAQEVLAGGPGSGFVALSGGFGTMEELMEVVTWNQLGIHSRGVVVLNVGGFWDPLFRWVDGSVEAGFIDPPYRQILRQAKDGDEVVRALVDYRKVEGKYKFTWDQD
jgi:uncharacterized protein (TIGR00730 family)